MRLTLPAVGVAAIVLLLAGCSAPTTATGSGTKPASTLASASPSETPTTPSAPTVDPTDAVNATTVLPDDFPPVIPLIDGDIITASSTSTGWEVWIASSDPISDYGEASSSLQDAGFTALADQSINGSAGGLFEDDQYSVTVMAGADAQYQNAVGYQVEKK